MGSNDSRSGEVDNRLEDLFGDENEDRNGEMDPQQSVEVDQRLNDFFGDGDDDPSDGEPVLSEDPVEAPEVSPPPRRPAKPKKPAANDKGYTEGDVEHSALKELKSVILSLEWEISDSLMDRLTEEVQNLEKRYKGDKIVVAFLQLLGSLCKYIQKKKAEAHPDSISLLNSVYENLEQVMLSEKLTDGAKKKMLVGEVNKYKQLKEQIKDFGKGRKGPSRPATRPEEAPKEPDEAAAEAHPAEESSSEVHGPVTNAEILAALDKIHRTLQSELRALREELREWRESR